MQTEKEVRLENKTFDEIQVGQSASLERVLSSEDIWLFASMSGDLNPLVADAEFAAQGRFHEVVAHGLWSGSLISTLLGTKLPGPGTIHVGQTFRFLRPVAVGDKVTATLTVKEKGERNHVKFFCVVKNQDEDVVMDGEAEAIAPQDKIIRDAVHLPSITLSDHKAKHDLLLDKAEGLVPLRIAVAHPCDRESLKGALDARAAGLIVPILVGPEQKIRQVAEENGFDLTGIEIVSVEHSHASGETAAQLCKTGQAEALMKGSLHTDEFMGPIVAQLRTARRVSHVFYIDAPTYPKPLLVTDAAVNIEPDLMAKADIAQNAIDLAKALGVEKPKMAILAAVETVNPKMRATIDAAALCKMADRGQIKGAIVDGPLAFDNAISAKAAKTKGIVSPVAGSPDILLVPDLEAGNMVAKQLEYLANAISAGIVLGAKVPVVLTSRSDGAEGRVASCALALIFARKS